jgi:hypothetical protein
VELRGGSGVGAPSWAARTVVAIWALAPTPWLLATQAEVFAANTLFAALILWLAAPAPPLPPGRRAVALAGVAGLALANQYTIGALAPLGLLAYVRAVRDARTRGGAIVAVVASAAVLALGLTSYALLFSASRRALDPATWSWGGVTDAASLVSALRREEYPAAMLSPASNVGQGIMRVVAGLAGLPVVAAAWLAVRTWRRGLPAGDRAAWIALLASYVVAGPVFATMFHVSLEGTYLAVTQRFDLLPTTLLVPVCAVGLERAASEVFAPDGRRTRFPRLSRFARWTEVAPSGLLVAAALAFGVARGLPSVGARHRPAVELYAKNVLLTAPRDAILLGTGDARSGGLLYARYALGLRPDVTFINPNLLTTAWYRERIRRATGVRIPEMRARKLDLAETMLALFSTGRPLVVTDVFAPKVIGSFPTYPIGPLVRLVARPEDVPSVPELERRNVELAARFEREPWPPPGPDPWSDALRDDYARPFVALAEAYSHAGDEVRAQLNRDRAEEARRGQ